MKARALGLEDEGLLDGILMTPLFLTAFTLELIGMISSRALAAWAQARDSQQRHTLWRHKRPTDR